MSNPADRRYRWRGEAIFSCRTQSSPRARAKFTHKNDCGFSDSGVDGATLQRSLPNASRMKVYVARRLSDGSREETVVRMHNA